MLGSGPLFFAILSGLLISAGIAVIAGLTRIIIARRQSAIVRRKLETTSRQHSGPKQVGAVLSGGGAESWVSRVLERAGIFGDIEKLVLSSGSGGSAESLAKASALATGGGAIVAGILANGNVLIAVLAAPMVGALPILRLYLRSIKRKRQFEQQLPDALDFMARALQAGHGVTMSFRMVAEEMPSPIAEEFGKVFDEINFGSSFQEALGGLCYRIASQDLNFCVVGMLIQRETGGNLAEMLHNLSTTIRERFKLQGKVRTLAAEGKYSGILLGVLPAIIGGILSMINPTYMSVLWETHTGQKWLMVSLTLMAIGFVWMWKIAKIKV